MPDPVIEERHLCRLLALAAIFISGIAGMANLSPLISNPISVIIY